MDADGMLLLTRQAQIQRQIEFARLNFIKLTLALKMIEDEARKGRREVIIPFMDNILEDALLGRGFETRPTIYDPNLIEVLW